MRNRFVMSLVVVSVLAAVAAPAFASYGSRPAPPPQPQPQPEGVTDSRDPNSAAANRDRADHYYRDAFDEVAKGSQALASGNKAAAKKQFRRALDRCRDAVEYDSTRFDAWNLIGFTSRQLGDYPHSFEAYKVALRQKPDYALAREYYGEGLLETGDLAGALEQLAWLKRIGDAEQLADLQTAVDRYRAAHPDSAAPPDSAATTSASH